MHIEQFNSYFDLKMKSFLISDLARKVRHIPGAMRRTSFTWDVAFKYGLSYKLWQLEHKCLFELTNLKVYWKILDTIRGLITLNSFVKIISLCIILWSVTVEQVLNRFSLHQIRERLSRISFRAYVVYKWSTLRLHLVRRAIFLNLFEYFITFCVCWLYTFICCILKVSST